YTSGQLLTIMGYLNFAVGMRLHFLIFSALQSVPFVALPYASKVAGFISDLDLKMPPLKFVNPGRLIAHIDYYWDIQQQIKKQIRDKLPAIEEKSRETNKILVSLLESIKD